MTCLDKEGQRWYCYKEDQVYFAMENRWVGTIQLPNPSTPSCPNCRGAIPSGAKFCPNCGQALTINVTKVLNSTIKILRQQPIIFLPILLELIAYNLLLVLFQDLLLPYYPTNSSFPVRVSFTYFYRFFPDIVFATILVALVLGMYPIMVRDAISGERIDLKRVFRTAIQKYTSLLFSSILVTIAIFLGAILFVVPGIIVAAWYFYTGPAIILEDRGGREGMSASKTFARHRKWKTFVLMLAAGVPLIFGPIIVYGGHLPAAYTTIVALPFRVVADVMSAVLASCTYLAYAVPRVTIEKSNNAV